MTFDHLDKADRSTEDGQGQGTGRRCHAEMTCQLPSHGYGDGLNGCYGRSITVTVTVIERERKAGTGDTHQSSKYTEGRTNRD